MPQLPAVDHAGMKLGVPCPSPLDPRDLKVKAFLNTFQMPAGPASTVWRGNFDPSSMFGNDALGDCTFAGVGHLQQLWTANTTGQAPIDEDALVSAYFAETGGADEGCQLIDVLKTWRQTGIVGNRIDAFARCDHTNKAEVQASIFTFLGLYAGVGLPLAWRTAESWDVGPGGTLAGAWEPRSWGLHCVDLVDYDADGLCVSTWGKILRCTWAAFFAYFFETWAAIDNLVTPGGRAAPNGYDAATIRRYLQTL